ncbi:hypothetical protein SDC9_107606 [bioreactor metagenome]|uniref:Uncharacterized protein n=1 Tax=bioreactor metagenome TaxID=1076179 RepID=A0A645B5Q9_9ZZZZ|nr:hypothetical protein [Erysipelotrichaceae bacterium]
MRKELPRMLIYAIISLLVFNFIPVLAIIFPESVAYYSFLLDIWIIVPIYVFVLGIAVSAINDMCVYLPVLVGVCYIPTMLIFYNDSIMPFIIAYVLLNFIGGFLGTYLYRSRIKEEY